MVREIDLQMQSGSRLGARQRDKVIRVWNGCSVIAVLKVSVSGATTQFTAGGAENSTYVDIEIDPWAGLIVDHMANRSPVLFREEK